MMAITASAPAPGAIRQRREQAGLTQAQAAAQVGVHVRSWQKWELGERTMPQPAWRLFLLMTGSPPTDVK
jgi:DNA (cytosine-5)-methyltransferase 1